MAKIGQGANVGAGAINYTFGDDAWRLAQSNVDAIRQVSSAVTGVTMDHKQNRETVKTTSEQLKAAAKLFPELEGQFTAMADQLNDPEQRLSDRAAVAKGMGEMIGMATDQIRFDARQRLAEQGMALDERALGMREAGFGFEMEQARFQAEQEQKAIKRATQMDEAMADPVLNAVLAETRNLESSGFTPAVSSLEIARVLESDTSGDQKLALANAAAGLLPQKAKRELKKIPIRINGQPGEALGYLDENDEFVIPKIASDLSKTLPGPLSQYADDFQSAGERYGVDPKVLAAIAMHETGNGTSSAFRNKNNAMGVSDSRGPVQMGSVAASIDKMAKLLGSETSGPYKNAETISEVANIYAPVGAGNDPRGLNQYWTRGVAQNLRELGGDPSAPIRIQAGAPTGKGQTEAERQKEQLEIQKLRNEVAGQEAEAAQAQEKAQADAAGKQETVDLLKTLKKHPGFEAAFGMSASRAIAGLPIVPDELETIPGTDKAGAVAIVEQIQGRTFLEAVAKMKGMGQLSDAEGKKLTQAASRLNRDLSDKEAAAVIDEMIETLESASGGPNTSNIDEKNQMRARFGLQPIAE